jgi:hypothetical protein
MIPRPECHAEAIVDQPIDIVWSIITDSSKFHALQLPGLYSPYDRKRARSGTQFEWKSIFEDQGKTSPQYIVDWKPPSHFSFGSSPNKWDFEWHLSPRDGKTIVHFARRFGSPWLNRIIDRLLGGNDLERLTEKTVASLKDACSRLASGEDDRLSPSPW